MIYSNTLKYQKILNFNLQLKSKTTYDKLSKMFNYFRYYHKLN